MPPYYPLKRVKKLLNEGHVRVNSEVQQKAIDLGLGVNDIIKCLLKLNSRPYSRNPEKNHYRDTQKHLNYSDAKMDFYKAKNIYQGLDIITHFHIDEEYETLVISGFHEL